MITNKKKNEKTTEIYFDETPAPVVIRTHNTALKKRLLAFAEKGTKAERIKSTKNTSFYCDNSFYGCYFCAVLCT